jgi:hypothetical protein
LSSDHIKRIIQVDIKTTPDTHDPIYIEEFSRRNSANENTYRIDGPSIHSNINGVAMALLRSNSKISKAKSTTRNSKQFSQNRTQVVPKRNSIYEHDEIKIRSSRNNSSLMGALEQPVYNIPST